MSVLVGVVEGLEVGVQEEVMREWGHNEFNPVFKVNITLNIKSFTRLPNFKKANLHVILLKASLTKSCH